MIRRTWALLLLVFLAIAPAWGASLGSPTDQSGTAVDSVDDGSEVCDVAVSDLGSATHDNVYVTHDYSLGTSDGSPGSSASIEISWNSGSSWSNSTVINGASMSDSGTDRYPNTGDVDGQDISLIQIRACANKGVSGTTDSTASFTTWEIWSGRRRIFVSSND